MKKQVLQRPAHSDESAPEALAMAFVTLIPQMMGVLRRHLRVSPQLELRPGQFRMLLLLCMLGPVSLSDLAEGLGLTLPTASKLAEELGKLGFVARRMDDRDRRRIELTLTSAGKTALDAVKYEAQRQLVGVFRPLTAAERSFLACAVDVMRPLFAMKPTEKKSSKVGNAGLAGSGRRRRISNLKKQRSEYEVSQ